MSTLAARTAEVAGPAPRTYDPGVEPVGPECPGCSCHAPEPGATLRHGLAEDTAGGRRAHAAEHQRQRDRWISLLLLPRRRSYLAGPVLASPGFWFGSPVGQSGSPCPGSRLRLSDQLLVGPRRAPVSTCGARPTWVAISAGSRARGGGGQDGGGSLESEPAPQAELVGGGRARLGRDRVRGGAPTAALTTLSATIRENGTRACSGVEDDLRLDHRARERNAIANVLSPVAARGPPA